MKATQIVVPTSGQATIQYLMLLLQLLMQAAVPTPLRVKQKKLRKGALLARRSIANVEMMWTWIHSLSFRSKAPL